MSDVNQDAFRAYARKCGFVFAAVVCGTLLMVGASYLPLANRAMANAIVLAGAAVNATLVASYLMHLVSERRAIHALLVFTAIFFVGLMGLTVWSLYEIPTAVKH